MAEPRLSEERWEELKELWSESYQIVIDDLEWSMKMLKAKDGHERLMSSIKISKYHREAMLGIIDITHDMNKIIHKRSP
jgi:hypothetical protein